ncbi:Os02g0784000, partial [Oryza sativa Japonica Group]
VYRPTRVLRHTGLSDDTPASRPRRCVDQYPQAERRLRSATRNIRLRTLRDPHEVLRALCRPSTWTCNNSSDTSRTTPRGLGVPLRPGPFSPPTWLSRVPRPHTSSSNTGCNDFGQQAYSRDLLSMETTKSSCSSLPRTQKIKSLRIEV